MTKTEQTFVIVKPDGVTRGLSGEILRRIEQRGMKIVALKLFLPTRDQIDEHYPKDETWIRRLGEKTKKTYDKYGHDSERELGTNDLLKIGYMVRGWIVDFMISAPVVAAVVEGVHAVDMVRKIVGPTIPAFAELGTVRGDYSIDSPLLANAERRALMNLVHASETPAEADHEIAHWFKPDEIVSYRRHDAQIELLKTSTDTS